MSKIDASHTAKPDPLGRRLFFDTETGLYEWEKLPDHIERPFANPALTGVVTRVLPEPEGSGIYKQHDPETGYTTVTGQVTAELPPQAASGMTIADEKEFEAQAKPVLKTRAAKNAKT